LENKGVIMRYFLLFLILLTSCSITPDLTVFTKTKPVHFTVELAKTSEQHQKGLMFRESLPDNHGMFFIFDNDAPRSFWMKNTLIPLDIIFINKDFIITGISHAIPCTHDPCTIYNGTGKYVLEINAGLSQKYNISVGDRIALNI